MLKRALSAAGLVAILAVAGGAEQPDPEQVDPAKSEELVQLGQDAFGMCDGCHSVEAGRRSSAGPNLFGVVGRPAGAVEGFDYTKALASSGITWDAATLDAYLADPEALVPGTDMQRGTVPEPDLREAIIAFLGTNGPQ